LATDGDEWSYSVPLDNELLVLISLDRRIGRSHGCCGYDED